VSIVDAHHIWGVGLIHDIIRSLPAILERPIAAIAALAVELRTVFELLADQSFRSCGELIENIGQTERAVLAQAAIDERDKVPFLVLFSLLGVGCGDRPKRMTLPTSAYVSIRQHSSAYVELHGVSR
jgi:hypothetical protein